IRLNTRFCGILVGVSYGPPMTLRTKDVLGGRVAAVGSFACPDHAFVNVLSHAVTISQHDPQIKLSERMVLERGSSKPANGLIGIPVRPSVAELHAKPK